MTRVRSALRTYLFEWVDIHRPTWRDVNWVLVGFLGSIIGVFLLSVGVDLLEAWLAAPTEPASHGTATEVERAAADGGVSARRLAAVLVSLWVAAVVEEFAIRNHMQKLIAAVTGWPVAIVATSLLFAGLHIPAYGGLPLSPGLATSLSSIFVLSLVFGTVYWRSGNIVVPMVVHGLWNTFALAVILVNP